MVCKMGISQQEEKPIIFNKNDSFLYQTIFRWVALISVIVCALVLLLLYKFELSFAHKKYESIKPPTIRQTLNGPVEGIEEISSLGQKYYAFRGIPFAEPPITGRDPYTGEQVDRRFKPPMPFKHNWTDVLKVHEFKSFCRPSVVEALEDLQNNTISENCLYMNLYVPAGGAKKKAVFVYIHGTGAGGGSTDLLMRPDFFLAHDNIVVYLSFRVEVFGFLNLGFGEYTGNMALKDQQLGMKWTYENIEFFSGNKNEILLFGDSVGSTCVHGHMLNAESRKYFTRAYLVSGTASLWRLYNGNHLWRMRRCLNFKGTPMELLNYMKSATYATLSKCNYLKDWLLFIESPNATAPFITKRPEEIYNSDEAPVMDAMFVVASQEAIKINEGITEWTTPLLKNWRKSKLVLPYEGFNVYSHPKEYNKVMAKLKKVYSPTNSSDLSEIIRTNIAYMSDIMLRDHVLQTVSLQANANTKSSDKSQHKKTYLMRLSMHSDLNAFQTKYKTNYTEMTHSDDICYRFICHYLDEFNVLKPHIIKKDRVYHIIMRNVQRMSNFARYGDPSIESDIPFKSCPSSNEIYCHDISNEPKMRITTDIKKQYKYDTWREIDDIYKNSIRK